MPKAASVCVVGVAGMEDAVRSGRGGARGQGPVAGPHHPAVAVPLLPPGRAREPLDVTRVTLCHNDRHVQPRAARPLVVKITCGAEAAERANQGWTVAAMGLAAGAPVTVWLTGEAVWFAVPGRQPDLALPHATPVAELVETVRSGGRLRVCSQCAARRS